MRQSLLVLDTHCRETKTVDRAGHGDEHGALLEDLFACQFARRIGAVGKAHAVRFIPCEARFT